MSRNRNRAKAQADAQMVAEVAAEVGSTKRYVAAKCRKDCEAGSLNPAREGKILNAIRKGEGASTKELIAITGLREPTVRYFLIEGGRANLIETIKLGGTYFGIVRANDTEASKTALKLRDKVLEMAASVAAEQTEKATTE